MEKNMKANGTLKDKEMEKDYKSGLMGRSMKDSGVKIRRMVEVD
jgi:hypothetical protein